MINFFKKKDEISPLYSGERETAVSLLKVKKEHIFRYNLAREILEDKYADKSTKGLDIFCANGYGTYFIAKFKKNTKIVGIDGSKDSIRLAKKHYKHKNTNYSCKIFPFNLKKSFYDYVICFESIEHIEDGEKLIKNIYTSLKKGGILIISTPNDDVLPKEGNLEKFHKKQYIYDDFSLMLTHAGFKTEKIYGQNLFELDENKRIIGLLPVKERHIFEGNKAQHMIFYCSK